MNNKTLYNICVIGGDGIGPEVVGETMRLLEAIHLPAKFTKAVAGFACYQKVGSPLPENTIQSCKEADSILFGAVTTPPHVKDYISPIVQLRRRLDLFSNVRPIFSLPIPVSRPNIDAIIVRENTEGLYAGLERKTRTGAIAQRVITKKASQRIIDFAFQLAVKQKRKKVTVVHKANILRLTDGLFLRIADEISQNYPNIFLEPMLVDTCAMKLIKKPEEFDVIVTTNMFGDILSDEAAALVGGLGIAASANIGDTKALFEPVHGSAPKYQGKNLANPFACFFAAVMMMEYHGEQNTAEKLKKGILQTLQNGCMTQDLGGKAFMREVTDEVINNYK